MNVPFEIDPETQFMPPSLDRAPFSIVSDKLATHATLANVSFEADVDPETGSDLGSILPNLGFEEKQYVDLMFTKWRANFRTSTCCTL